MPIEKAVKKAASQIKATKAHLGRSFDFGVLIVVNNGFNSLPHDEFDNLVLTYCRNSTSQIDFILATTVEYHHGDFDAYVFCYSLGYSVVGGLPHPYEDKYIEIVGEEFKKRMTEMMQDEDFHKTNKKLEPVVDIRLERDGIKYIRLAPEVPNSMFDGPPKFNSLGQT